MADKKQTMLYGLLTSIASKITYDNTASGLTANNVQDAIDEINSNLGIKYKVATKTISATLPKKTDGSQTSIVTDAITEVGLTRKSTSIYILKTSIGINSFVNGVLQCNIGNTIKEFCYLPNSVYPNATSEVIIEGTNSAHINVYNGLDTQYSATVKITVFEFENVIRSN